MFLWLAFARHFLFSLKLFYSPGRTGGCVFAEETRQQTALQKCRAVCFCGFIQFSAAAVFVKRRVAGVEILAVERIGSKA